MMRSIKNTEEENDVPISKASNFMTSTRPLFFLVFMVV